MSHNGDFHFKESQYEAEKVEEQEPDLEDDDSGSDEFSHSERAYESQLERDHGYN